MQDLNQLGQDGSLKRIKRVLMVMSGKGGVGKSTITAHLAAGLAARDYKVGILDADLTGPSVPWIFKNRSSVYQSSSGWLPAYVDCQKKLGIMSVGLLMPNTEEAVIMRGPRKAALITRFVHEVCWGDLDYLLVDTPPGVGDEQLSLAKLFEGHPNLRTVLVTTPQLVSLSDVHKQLRFCECANIKIFGIVENMSTFKCPNCSHCSNIFPVGPVREFASKQKINYLGSVGLNSELSDVFENICGEFSLSEYERSQQSRIFSNIVDQIEKSSNILQHQIQD